MTVLLQKQRGHSSTAGNIRNEEEMTREGSDF